jgi:pre-rRNA-processing protein TSR2
VRPPFSKICLNLMSSGGRCLVSTKEMLLQRAGTVFYYRTNLFTIELSSESFRNHHFDIHSRAINPKLFLTRSKKMSSFSAVGEGVSPVAPFICGVTAILSRWSALRAAVQQEWGGNVSMDKARWMQSEIIAMFCSSSSNGSSASQQPQQFLTKKGGKSLTIDPQDLEDELLIWMEEEFSCQLEDGSERELAKIIVEMYNGCVQGDTSLVMQMLDYAVQEEYAAAKKNDGKNPNVRIAVEGEMDEDDDDESESEIGDDDDADANADDDDDMEMEEGEDEMNAPQLTPAAAAAAVAVPFTDEDRAKMNVIGQNFSQGYMFGVLPPAAPILPPARQLGDAPPVKAAPVLDDDGFESVAPRRSNRLKNSTAVKPTY